MKDRFMRKIFQKISGRYGFTLVETMVSLMIFSVSITIIFMILQGLHHEFKEDSSTDFYLYLRTVEDRGYRIKNCDSQRLALSKGGKTYNVRFSKNKLIISTDKGGYIPILDNVSSVDWSARKNILNSRVEMTDGKRFSGRSVLREK